MKTWRVRRELTHKKSALEWNRAHPGGLARLMQENLERDISLIRAELEESE